MAEGRSRRRVSLELVRDKAFYFVNFDQQLRNFPGFVRAGNENSFYNAACTAPGCAACSRTSEENSCSAM